MGQNVPLHAILIVYSGQWPTIVEAMAHVAIFMAPFCTEALQCPIVVHRSWIQLLFKYLSTYT